MHTFNLTMALKNKQNYNELIMSKIINSLAEKDWYVCVRKTNLVQSRVTTNTTNSNIPHIPHHNHSIMNNKTSSSDLLLQRHPCNL